MMDLPKLIILDVGHGNSALLIDEGVTVIDCAEGSVLVDTLEMLNIDEVSQILISHADADHIAGVITLILSQRVKVLEVYINPDPSKDSDVWFDLRTALKAAQTKGVKVHPSLASDQTGRLDKGEVHIEILAPTPEFALGGVKGTDLERRRLYSNSMSVVIRLIHKSQPIVLITGDLDGIALRSIIKDNIDLQADVLIFPHHGGSPKGMQPRVFAETLCNLVRPNLVIFSIGRGIHSTPRPDIIEGVRSAVPTAHIVCTQLSEHCSLSTLDSDFEHCADLPAKGRSRRLMCGGTLDIDIDGATRRYDEFVTLHRRFVEDEVSTPLCVTKPRPM